MKTANITSNEANEIVFTFNNGTVIKSNDSIQLANDLFKFIGKNVWQHTTSLSLEPTAEVDTLWDTRDATIKFFETLVRG